MVALALASVLAVTWTEDFLSRCELPEDRREELWARGVSNWQIETYRIGYLDSGLPELELPTTFTKWSHGGKRVEECFVFPLTNWLGEIQGFQFRPADRERKGYMDYFLDRKQAVSFGLGPAGLSVWETRRVCIVEGVFDLFPVQRLVPWVVSVLTAKVANQFARSLSRVVDEAFLLLDDDAAGRLGTERFLKYYQGWFRSVEVIRYPTGVSTCTGSRVKDPGDIWEAWGDERFASFFGPQLR